LSVVGSAAPDPWTFCRWSSLAHLTPQWEEAKLRDSIEQKPWQAMSTHQGSEFDSSAGL
jgi:hypothetical protein